MATCHGAITLRRQLDSRHGQASTLHVFGYAHHHLGDRVGAVSCYEQAAKAFRDLGDRHEEAATLTRLGDTHRAAGDPIAAGSAYRQALAILDEIDHPAADAVRTNLTAVTALAALAGGARDDR